MIGSELRRERERRGLGLDEMEARTKIRVRYLAALEDGRYEVLPGAAYARAFLRDYAGELGVDPTAELLDLEDPAVELPPAEPRPRSGRWARRGRVAAAVLVLAAVALAAAGSLIGGAPSPHRVAGGGSSPHAVRPAPPASTPAPAPTPAAPRPSVRLAATNGPSWLEVREGSAGGRLLYEGTLQPGASIVLHHRLVWLRTGAPWDLVIRIDGRRLTVPVRTPGDLMIAGGRVAAAA